MEEIEPIHIGDEYMVADSLTKYLPYAKWKWCCDYMENNDCVGCAWLRAGRLVRGRRVRRAVRRGLHKGGGHVHERGTQVSGGGARASGSVLGGRTGGALGLRASDARVRWVGH